MSQDVFPADAVKAEVSEEIQKMYPDGSEIALSLTKALELRVKTDKELIGCIQELIKEIGEVKALLTLAVK